MIKGMDFGTRWPDFITLVLAFTICVISDEFLNLCVPQFSHLENENSNDSIMYNSLQSTYYKYNDKYKKCIL